MRKRRLDVRLDTKERPHDGDKRAKQCYRDGQRDEDANETRHVPLSVSGEARAAEERGKEKLAFASDWTCDQEALVTRRGAYANGDGDETAQQKIGREE